MKRFAANIVFIFLIIFFITYALDVYYTNNLKLIPSDKSDERAVWNDIYESKIDVDIAIYGSSRAWVHVDPEIIDSVLNTSSYNLGMDGYPFHMQYYRHKEYFKYNQKPKTIILL